MDRQSEKIIYQRERQGLTWHELAVRNYTTEQRMMDEYHRAKDKARLERGWMR